MLRTLFVSLIAGAVLLMNGLSNHCLASVLYISNSNNNSNTSINGTNYNSLPGSKGISFTTGPSGPYSTNVMDVIFFANTGTPSASTFKVDLRNTTSTTPGSAMAGTTLYATDILSLPVTSTGSYFTHEFTAADFPNISAYSLGGSASYSFSFYGANSGLLAIGRMSSPTYVTTNGFTVLNSITGGNNYAGSYDVSFGTSSGPSTVPEPSTYALFCIGLGAVGYARKRMNSKS